MTTPEQHPPADTDVLIVGAGPAGLTTALALARLGIRSTVLTRYPGTAHTPRAHVINLRTMEIFRHLGVEDRMLAVADPAEYLENTPWVTSLAGAEIARITAWGQGAADRSRYARASPGTMANLPQHLLEPVLLAAALETSLVDVRFGHELISLAQDDDAVAAVVRVRESGREYPVTARYLVGADGARSRVMDQVGLTLDGPPPFGEVAFAWIRAELGRFVAHRPATLVHVVVPGRAGFIMVRAWDEWIATLLCEPGFDPDDHAAITERIHAGIGDPTVEVEIRNVSRWSTNGQVAPRYSRGRVFCMGDAVHRHSPWNGLGLNTSIADAHNLAWKLALVLDGVAGPGLLETYSAERAPVGRQVVDRASATGAQMMRLPDILGLTPGMPDAEVWKRLDLLEDGSPDGVELRRRLDEHLASMAGPGYNALGVEIGYRYRAGAVVPDGTPEPVAGDPETEYLATTWPGARVPHVWLEVGRARASTLDMVGHGRFTLFVGRRARPWIEAAARVADVVGSLVQVVRVGGPDGVRDPLGDWARAREVGEDGAVLVRPDAHVAWRSVDATGAADLESVVLTVLGRRPRAE